MTTVEGMPGARGCGSSKRGVLSCFHLFLLSGLSELKDAVRWWRAWAERRERHRTTLRQATCIPYCAGAPQSSALPPACTLRLALPPRPPPGAAPWSLPSPRFCSLNMAGTTRPGPTAFMMNPSVKPSVMGMPNTTAGAQVLLGAQVNKEWPGGPVSAAQLTKHKMAADAGSVARCAKRAFLLAALWQTKMSVAQESVTR